MQQLSMPLGFGHRGARAMAPDNTLESFRLAIEHGASGIETDVWVSADGQVVCDHDGVYRRGLRRWRASDLPRDQLPPHIPSLDDVYDLCGDRVQVSCDVKDPVAAAAAVAVAARHGRSALERLWLCHPDPDRVIGWRALDPRVRLVNSTRLRSLREGPELRARRLAEGGVDAINMHATDWTPGLVALIHRFELRCFAWDAQYERVLVQLLAAGVDALYSDHVALMMEVIGAYTR